MRRKNQVGCSCCGGTFCGLICTACGGIRLVMGDASITDANGTVGFFFDPSLGFWVSEPLQFQPGYLNFEAVDFCSGGPSLFPLSYRYVFACVGDQISVTVFQYRGIDGIGWFLCTGIGSGCCSNYIRGGIFGAEPGYYTRYDGFGGGFQLFKGSIVPTCANGTLDATVPIPGVPGFGDVTIPPPAPEVSLTVPIEVAHKQLCCLPCGIPLTDLTVSWTGSSPGSAQLIRNDTSWASPCTDGKVWTLGCSPNSSSTRVSIASYANDDCTGAATDSGFFGNLIDATCIPYHLHYRVDSAHNPLACKILNGGMVCGSEAIDIYIDE